MFAWLHRLFGGGRGPTTNLLFRPIASLDANERCLKAEALGQIEESWAANALVPLLADTDNVVRETARKGLERLGALALPALLRGLNDQSADVGQAAAEMLGELRAPESVGPLLTTLKYAQRPVQLAATRALTRLGELAVPALTAAREEPQPWVRGQVEAILAAIRGVSS